MPNYPKPAPEKLPLWKKILARLMLVPYGWAGLEEGFRAPTRIYLFRCGRCGRYSIDYLRGYRSYVLCYYCTREGRETPSSAMLENSLISPLSRAGHGGA